MVKLIESSQFADVPEIGVKLAEFRSPAMSKEAENIFGRSYESLKPTDDRYVGIHLTALGSEERYGPNRNFDSFPKEACVKYHDTFVKHGHVFSHHHNDAAKDPILGSIKASAYNDKMDRVELFIWADKEAAAEGLATLEKTGECAFSMACRVPWDECSICGAHRRNSADPNMCDHIRNELGKVAEDGSVAFMRNVEPDFFDISFVTRPADRIAYSLKVASLEGPVTSEKLAEASGIVAPSYIDPGLEADKRAVLRKLSEAYDDRTRYGDSRTMSIIKSAACCEAASLDDVTIDTLRRMPVKEAMAFLSDNSVVMGADDFCKYAMGPGSSEYAAVRGHAGLIGRLASEAVKEADCLGRFGLTGQSDMDCDRFTPRPSRRFTEVAFADGVLKRASFSGDNLLSLAVSAPAEKSASVHVDTNDNVCLNGAEIPVLAMAMKYAEYKVASLNNILSGNGGFGGINTDKSDSLFALVAAQDL